MDVPLMVSYSSPPGKEEVISPPCAVMSGASVRSGSTPHEEKSDMKGPASCSRETVSVPLPRSARMLP